MKQNIKAPWDIELEERLKKIINNCSKRKVIYIYERADTSTFRYRAYNQCQSLDFSSLWIGTYFFANELHILEKYLELVDVVIFCRVCWSPPVDIFFHQVKKYKIPTVFDIDDLIFNVEKLPIIMNTLGICEKSYDPWFSYSSRLWMMGKMCDYTCGTNEFLCEQLRQTFNKFSFVLNNFLNKEQIDVSEQLFQKKKTGIKKNSTFKIGYFSGSPTHKNDFERIVIEIKHLLDTYPEIILDVVGFMEFPKILQKHINKKQITFTPLVDFLTLQEKIAGADVNIVPLVDNVFTNCKSELKFFEASIVGTITCATPTYVFKDNIHHEHTGFLCEEGDWDTTIEKIFKRTIDVNVSNNAQEYCLKKYSPQSQCCLIEKSLDVIAN